MNLSRRYFAVAVGPASRVRITVRCEVTSSFSRATTVTWFWPGQSGTLASKSRRRASFAPLFEA